MNLIGNLFSPIFWLIAGFLISLGGVSVVRFCAHRYGWLVEPRPDRWHSLPTALHGGVGMMMAWLPLSLWLFYHQKIYQSLVGVLIVGALIMFFLGLLDDFCHFQPSTKLIWQIVASGLLIEQGMLIKIFPWYSLNVFFTFIWFIGIINAVNMLDNMDGLSAGVVSIGALVLSIIFSMVGGPHVFAVQWLAIFIGVLWGFLIFNFNPASIFMGDSGSLFIGYFLAAMSLPSSINKNWFMDTTGNAPSWSVISLFAPVMILSVPIFDTTLVTILRKLHGRSASEGGKDHSSHRLVGLGLNEKQAAFVLYGVAGMGGLVSVLSCFFRDWAWVFFLGFFILLGLFGIYLGKFKVYEEDSKTESWTPLVSNLLHKRRFSETILDFVFVVASYSFAFNYLFGGNYHEEFFNTTLPLVVIVVMGSFWIVGCYRGLWHFFRMADFVVYLKGVLLAGIVLSALIGLNGMVGELWWLVLPQHYVILFFLFVTLLLSMIFFFRFSLRYLSEHFYKSHSKKGDMKTQDVSLTPS